MKQTWQENKASQTIIAWKEVTHRIDDEALFARIATLFLRDSSDRVESLARAVEDEDSESVHFLAHAIKGSAATLAAHRLTSAAKDLECAARSHAADSFARLYAVLQNEYQKVNAALSDPGWHDAYQQHSHSPMSH